jgi:hypothetical protein
MRDFFRSKGFPFYAYGALSFTAFFPCLVLGNAYFDNDLMNSFGQFRSFLKTQLLQGHFPLWDPYLMGGQPFFAHPCSMMCYPPTYLTLLFPIPYGLSVFFFLHLFWGASGMHFWLKKLALCETACYVGAASFALSGFFWWELVHPIILAVFAWFPWFLLCLEEWSRSFHPKWAFGSGLCFALVFVSGNFQTAVYVFYAGLAYFLFRLLAFRNEKKGLPDAGLRRFLFSLLFALWGGLPLLAHLIPAMEYFHASDRDQASLNYDNLNAVGSMKPLSVSQLFFPALGVPPDGSLEVEIQSFEDRVRLENRFFGALGYIGIWAPLLMVLAFFRGRDKKWFYFLSGLSLTGLLSAFGRYFPLHRWECALLPGMGLSRAPYRFLEIYVFFACALCALGFEALEKGLGEKKEGRLWVQIAGLYAIVLLLVGLKNPRQAWVEMISLGLGLAGLYLWSQNRGLKKAGKASFLLSILVSLLGAGWSGYSLGPPSNFDLEKNFPAFSRLRENRESGRYYFDSSLFYNDQSLTSSFRCFFPEDSVMALGLRSAGGYGGFELQNAMDLREVPFKNFLKLMAVRGLLFGHGVAAPEGYLDFPFGDTHLYELKNPPPYLFAPALVHSVAAGGDDLAMLKKLDFDPERAAVLSGPLPDGFTPSAAPANLRYFLLQDDPDDEVFKVLLDQKNLVVFSEIVFPGWKAWVDGRPAALYTADHALRALILDAGEHSVEFRYQPLWFKPIIAGAGIWLLSLIAFGFFLRTNNKNR